LCREVVSVSAERLSDFCICQTYAISGYDTAYRRKMKIIENKSDFVNIANITLVINDF